MYRVGKGKGMAERGIKVFPETIATGDRTSQDQIAFLFLCTENPRFHGKNVLPGLHY